MARIPLYVEGAWGWRRQARRTTSGLSRSPGMPRWRCRCRLRRDTGRAMSQENVEAIRTAIGSGPSALLAILDDEVEWDYVGAFPEVVSYHGPQQVGEFFRE